MSILTRYLLKSHAGPFLFALTMLTGLLLINTVARRFEDLAGKGLSARVILEVFVLSIPHIVALTLPMAVLVAVLFTFSQIAAENEITALKASGVNLARLLVPLVVAAAILAGAMVWFNDQILPETNHRLKNLLVDISRKSPTLQLKEQVINEIQTGDMRTRYFLQAGDIDPVSNRLKDVVIYDLSLPGRSRTVYADSGRMAFNREQTDLFLNLYDGSVNELNEREPENFQRVFFDQQVIRLRGVGNQLQRTTEEGFRGDREMSIGMLRAEIVRYEREIEQLEAERAALNAGPAAEAGDTLPAPTEAAPLPRMPRPEEIRQAELEMIETRAEALRNDINRNNIEIQKKYSIPFACIVFVLIGAPLAVRFPRGGVGFVIAASLAIFAVYWIGLRGGEVLGDEGYVPTFWAMWITNVIGLAIGLWAISRVGKEVSTARGGGWEDFRAAMRGFMAHPLAALRGSR